MRKTPDVTPPSTASGYGLAIALVCAFAGCLNPLPEEYPSDTTSTPGAPGAGNADPARQGADFNPTAAPDSEPAPNAGATDDDSPAPPSSLRPPAPADAGIGPDGGLGDAGASEPQPGDAGAPDAGAPPNDG